MFEALFDFLFSSIPFLLFLDSHGNRSRKRPEMRWHRRRMKLKLRRTPRDTLSGGIDEPESKNEDAS
jgi:hypothetical protein